jgi:hypothetical protein
MFDWITSAETRIAPRRPSPVPRKMRMIDGER